MGLTPFDVTNLNQSIEGLGQTFRQKRLDTEALRREAAAETLRQQMNAATMQHYKAEESHYDAEAARGDRMEKKASEGHVESWLQDPDGGTFKFTGAPEGLQQLQTTAQQKGRPLTVL